MPADDEVGIPTEVQRAVDRQISSEGRAVLVFALAVAVVATLLFALAMSRQLGAEGADRGLLRSLGVRRSELVVADLVRSLAVAVGAAARPSPCRSACLAGSRSAWGDGRCATAGWTSTAPCCSSGACSSRSWWSAVVLLAGWRQARTVEHGRRRRSRIGSPGSVRRLPRRSACTWPSTGHRPRWPVAARSRSVVWPSR